MKYVFAAANFDGNKLFNENPFILYHRNQEIVYNSHCGWYFYFKCEKKCSPDVNLFSSDEVVITLLIFHELMCGSGCML